MAAGVAELVGGDDARADRCKGIEALALEPLTVRLLHLARRDIVDDGVAEHRRQGIAFAQVGSLAPHHDAQLDFIIELLGAAAIPLDVVAVADHRRGRLGKELRHRREAHRHAARARAFLDMQLVVAADAEHVFLVVRNRRHQLDRRQRHPAFAGVKQFPRVGQGRIAGGDERQHVARQVAADDRPAGLDHVKHAPGVIENSQSLFAAGLVGH